MNGKRGRGALMRMCRPREAFRRSIRRNEGNGKDCEPMMRTSLLFSMLVAGGLFLALAAGAEEKKDDAKGDDRFVTEAAVGGLMEVKLGLLAMEHASNAEVKKFAQRMVDDHGKANKDLMGVADKKGIKVSI